MENINNISQIERVDKYIVVYEKALQEAHILNHDHMMFPHPNLLTPINEKYIEDYFNRRGYKFEINDCNVSVSWPSSMNLQYQQ